jgi:hypothetical protein
MSRLYLTDLGQGTWVVLCEHDDESFVSAKTQYFEHLSKSKLLKNPLYH